MKLSKFNWGKVDLRLVILISVLLGLSSCCTKKDCNCPEVKIDIYADYDGDEYSLIRTTKDYVKIDSIRNLPFYVSDRSAFCSLSRNSFNFTEDESIDDFHYLLKNLTTAKVDTISNIVYDFESYSFECNDCFLAKDIKHCEHILNPQLTFNGELVNEHKVIVD